MAFDGITIANLAYEFKSTLEGGKIAKIAQPEKQQAVGVALLDLIILPLHRRKFRHASYLLAIERPGVASGDLHVHEPADKGRVPAHMHEAAALRARRERMVAPAVGPVDEHALHAALIG